MSVCSMCGEVVTGCFKSDGKFEICVWGGRKCEDYNSCLERTKKTQDNHKTEHGICADCTGGKK